MSELKKRPREVSNHSHPSGDERYNTVERTMKRYMYEKDALLEVLHAAQETFGYLSEDLIIYISNQLNVPMSQVYGVATFYHLFTFEPLGKHNCTVCTGTACYVKGAMDLENSLSNQFNVEVGATTDDGQFSLTNARCLGSCGIAPVVVLDGKVYGKETPKSMIATVEGVLEKYSEELAEVETG